MTSLLYKHVELFLSVILMFFSGLAVLLERDSLAVLFVLLVVFYVPLIAIARKIGSVSFSSYIFLMIGTRLIALPLMNLNQDKFEHSGWAAVKNFDFSPSAYLNLLLIDGASLYLLALMFFIAWSLFRKQFRSIQTRPYEFKSVKIPFRSPHGGAIAAFVVVFIWVSYFIFKFGNENKIGIPGVMPNELPYRLAGWVFYYQKFIGPILLYLIIRKSSSVFLFCGLALLLPFIGLVTLSRSAVAFWSVPLLLIAYRNCKSRFVVLFIVFTLTIGALLAEAGRGLMYVNDNEALAFDESVKLSEVVVDVVQRFEISDIFSTAGGLVSRMGGGQDLVLGTQAVLPSIDYSLMWMFEMITGVYAGIDMASLTQITHDFVPWYGTVAGLSYSGYMLAFLNTNFLVFLLFITITCALIFLNEIVRKYMLIYSNKVALSSFVCFALNLICFGMLMFTWYWSFVFLTGCYFFIMRMFFIKKKLSINTRKIRYSC